MMLFRRRITYPSNKCFYITTLTSSSSSSSTTTTIFRNKLNEVFHLKSNINGIRPSRQSDLDDLLSKYFSEISIQDLLLLFRYASRKNDVSLAKWTSDVTRFISNINVKLQASQILELLCGLKCMSLPENGVKDISAFDKSFSMTKIGTSHESQIYELVSLYNKSIQELQFKIKISSPQLAGIFYSFARLNGFREEMMGLVENLTPSVEACEDTFTSGDIARMLYGLRNFSSAYKPVQELLRILVTKLSKARITTTSNTFTAQEMAMSLYGLQGIRSHDPHALSLINALTIKLHACPARFNAQYISMSLYGLQGMANSEEIHKLLSVLTPKISQVREKFSAQAIGNSLYGLQHMDSKHIEVRNVLSALLPHIQACKEPFQPCNIALSLYGLHHMDSHEPEVLAVLEALIPKIAVCAETFRPSEVSMSLYGLRRMDYTQPEVLRVLEELVPRCCGCVQRLSLSELSMSIYGLQGLRSNTPQIVPALTMLTNFAISIRLGHNSNSCTSNNKMKPQHVAMILYGLRNMYTLDTVSGRYVLDLLAALLPLLKTCTDKFNSQEVAMTIFGLRGLNASHHEVQELITILIPKIGTCQESLSDIGIQMVLLGQANLNSRYRVVRELRSVLKPLLVDRAADIGMTLRWQNKSGVREKGETVVTEEQLVDMHFSLAW